MILSVMIVMLVLFNLFLTLYGRSIFEESGSHDLCHFGRVIGDIVYKYITNKGMTNNFQLFPQIPPIASFATKQIEIDLVMFFIPCSWIYMSHFSYSCKMRYPLNLVLENWEYLWFY